MRDSVDAIPAAQAHSTAGRKVLDCGLQVATRTDRRRTIGRGRGLWGHAGHGSSSDPKTLGQRTGTSLGLGLGVRPLVLAVSTRKIMAGIKQRKFVKLQTFPLCLPLRVKIQRQRDA